MHVDLVLEGVAEAGLDPASVERLVTGVLEDLGVEGQCALAVCVVDDDAIRALNRTHRGLDSFFF